MKNLDNDQKIENGESDRLETNLGNFPKRRWEGRGVVLPCYYEINI
jgi:hypothetical protein